MSIGNNIKLKRLSKGYTLEELANFVGTSKQTIQRYETAVISNIPADKIEKIASALDTTPSFLMGWDDNDSYTNDDKELNDYLKELKNRPEMKMLFSVSKGCTKEDVEKTVKMLEIMRGGKSSD